MYIYIYIYIFIYKHLRCKPRNMTSFNQKVKILNTLNFRCDTEMYYINGYIYIYIYIYTHIYIYIFAIERLEHAVYFFSPHFSSM